MKRRRLLMAITLLVLLGAYAAFSFFDSFTTVTVDWTNVKKVSLYSTVKTQYGDSEAEPAPLVTVSVPGSVIKIHKGIYTLYFEGKDGYKDLRKNVDLTNGPQTISVHPPYSDRHLDMLLATELPSINKSLNDAFPSIKNYDVQRGQLYRTGEWYGTTLIYTGPDIYNADTLRVALHKTSIGWVVATKTPDVNLNIYQYPLIPVEILKSINTL